ncbi:chaperone modulator CbpM [Nitrosomonas communis]|uniref:chaperone modulator CbpM n=1 Tax=Nitrosomonas communis TaxID=44574 RepID=UPI0026EB8C34|nr:chaperone modulator CbpM [Nitrosomonas communis]MCO6429084.1 MerR family transcriptional regulator [Nitrosomonas communis]
MTINHNIIEGIIIADDTEFSPGELSSICAVSTEWITALVEEGILEPLNISSKRWRFNGACVQRIQLIQRLQRDLDINLAGAALALQLLEEIAILRTRLSIRESSVTGPTDSQHG